MKLPEPPKHDGWASSGQYGYHTDAQLEAYGKLCAEAMREECAEAATDEVAFNGGSVQMEAHVRQAIRKLEVE